MIETHLFEQVADAVRSLGVAMADDQVGVLRLRAHRRGVKAWFGAEQPPRAHYEAQMIPRRYVDGTDGVAIEIGFHAEFREPERNQQVLAMLEKHQKAWRKKLGPEAEMGVFLGADSWRRVSETWLEPDLEDPELAFAMAARLVDYLQAIEPVLSAHGPDA